MKRLLLTIALVSVLAGVAYAEVGIVPTVLPTPVHEIAHWVVFRTVALAQRMKPDGTVDVAPRYDVEFMALDANYRCVPDGSANGNCITRTMPFSGPVATLIQGILDTADMSKPGQSQSTRQLTTWQANGGPAGAIGGTPGITVQPTPTPGP